ncbi:hypothetical protein [Nocardia sp. NPDC050406]|uniref:hypothetical protein n=1 Tax=Nocardia sp. NPDC050406 TaxID=3364318 RepID=UPI00378E7111
MRIGSDRNKKNEAPVDDTTADDQRVAPHAADQPGTGAGDQSGYAAGSERAGYAGTADRTGATEAIQRPDQSDERIVKSGGPERDLGTHRAPSTPTLETGEPLIAVSEVERLRMQWREVQGLFVDNPQDAVSRADELVEGALRQLTETCADRKRKLEGRWSREDSGDTEELRQAMRGYRAFFDQLLATGG